MTQPKIEIILDDSPADFREIDFVRGLPKRLHSKLTFVKGVLVKKEYFENAVPNPTTQQIDYSNLIVVEDHIYTRNEFGLAVMRDVHIRWVLEDETFSPDDRHRYKYYDPVASLKEGEIRRRNVIDGLKPKILGMLQITGDTPTEAFTDAQEFFQSYQGDINAYLESGGIALATRLQNDTEFAWLDSSIGQSSIRSALIYEIT